MAPCLVVDGGRKMPAPVKLETNKVFVVEPRKMMMQQQSGGPQVYKPLLPILILSQRLKIGKFPLVPRRISDSPGVNFSLNKGTYVGLVMLNLICLAALAVVFLAVAFEMGSVRETLDVFIKAGLTPTDVCAGFLLFGPNFGFNIWLLQYFSGLDAKLNRFCNDFASIDQGMEEDKIRHIWKGIRNLALFISGTIVVAAACNCVSIVTIVNMSFSTTGILEILLIVFTSIALPVLFCPPSMLLIHVIVVHTLSCLKLVIEELLERMEANDDIKKIRSLVQQAFKVESLVSQADVMFGGIILVEYACTLLVVSCGIYFGISMPMDIAVKDEFTVVPFCMGLACLMLAIFAATRQSKYMTCGQAIAKSYAEVRRYLEQFLMTVQESEGTVDETTKTSFDIIISRFSKASPFRPQDTFDLNLSTSFSMYGLVLTYLIVLLQFKAS